MFTWEKDQHKCAPYWMVWSIDAGQSVDDCTGVYARDEQEAVEIWAEREDSKGDYTIIGGDEETVMVCRMVGTTPSEESATRYIVSGETVSEYHARKVE
jgi:hypothetical protein